MERMWGGRFAQAADDLMQRLNDSLRYDKRLWREDIGGSKAYADALAEAGILTREQAAAIKQGLDDVYAELEKGEFAFKPSDEDIHTAVERRLVELVGEVGEMLHTGRSRNDQVATDSRLWLRRAVKDINEALRRLVAQLVSTAGQNLEALMPGFTHLQPAQPVRFAHWLLGYAWQFQRDYDRLRDMHKRADVLPLGSGALSGTPYAINRHMLARTLGFAGVSSNSIDAIADRDYLAEFLACAAIIQVHLSRLAEDLILFSSRQYNFIEIAEEYATGSSLMPQKKNPDSLELIRAKTGRVVGHLAALLTVLKGLPSSYNKDLQEDKEIMFDAADTLLLTVPIAERVVATMKVHPEAMRQALSDDMLATELADYLVQKGLAFRRAHRVVGQVVRRALELGCPLSELPLEEYQAINSLFAEDLYPGLYHEAAVEKRMATGGTALAAVQEQIFQLERWLDEAANFQR